MSEHRDPMDFSDLDYLEGVDGPKVAGVKIIPELAAAPVEGLRERGTYPCGRCNGTGRWRGGRKCHACRGRGAFKQSPERREKNREQRLARIARKRDEIYAEHPGLEAALEWRAAKGSGFAISVQRRIETQGFLSDRQLAVVLRMVEEDRKKSGRGA